MADVETALNECAEEWTRGVYSFHQGPEDSDLGIHDDVIPALKNVLRPTFQERLVHEGRSWNDDRNTVLRTAFHGGALAAFYAHNDREGSADGCHPPGNRPMTKCVLLKRHALPALKHVSEHCNGPEEIRPEWKYCPPWPFQG